MLNLSFKSCIILHIVSYISKFSKNVANLKLKNKIQKLIKYRKLAKMQNDSISTSYVYNSRKILVYDNDLHIINLQMYFITYLNKTRNQNTFNALMNIEYHFLNIINFLNFSDIQIFFKIYVSI